MAATTPLPSGYVLMRGKALVDGFCSACHLTGGLDIGNNVPIPVGSFVPSNLTPAGPLKRWSDGELTGGLDIGNNVPIPVGSFVPSNLTPAGPLKRWSDGEIFRAIRNGADADGRWLTIMSYTNAGRLSDEDTQAVIAYIRSVPA